MFTQINCLELIIISVQVELRTVATLITVHTLLMFFPFGFTVLEQKNPLLQLKQAGVGIGRVKRRYKRKNAGSPVKKGPSPVKRRQTANSPAKIPPASVKSRGPMSIVKVSHQSISYMKAL